MWESARSTPEERWRLSAALLLLADGSGRIADANASYQDSSAKLHVRWPIMDIVKAQRDVRETFLGGFAGQLVSAVLWGGSAAACTWWSLRLGGIILILGGCLIFPLTQTLLRLMGHSFALPKGHPMNALAMQVAFTLPLSLPVVLGIAALRPAWFYPAFMIVLGAHYLPFVFLYGMWQFAGLCAVLVGSGLALGMYLPHPVSLGAWLTAIVLLIFAFTGRSTALRQASRGA